MPQGHMKTKVNMPGGVKQKNKQRGKALGPKKGGRSIAPKKSRIIEAGKMKKALEKSINAKIEKDVAQKAHSNTAKPFHVISSVSSTSTDKTGKKK